MKFKVTEFINDWARVEEDGALKHVVVEKKYEVPTWDDFQNLLCTIIEASTKPVTFEVRKIEEDGHE